MGRGDREGSSKCSQFLRLAQWHFNVEVTDEKIKNAIAVMNRERRLRRELATLLKSQSPPLTGRQLLEFKSIISGICEDFEQYDEAIKFYKSRKADCSKDSKVRVLMTGVPIVHGAERVLDIIESHGGLVVCMDNCTCSNRFWKTLTKLSQTR